jgi:hypothetical protein
VSERGALTDEINNIWDELRRMKSSMSQSLLPEGFTWDDDGDGLVIISPSGTRTTIS